MQAGCSDSAEARYRVTVTVDDDGVRHSGSSVWSNRLSAGGPATPYSGRFRGEAVTVDLGEKGKLFALLIGRTAEGELDKGAAQMMPERLFGDVGRAAQGESPLHKSRIEDLRAIANCTGAERALECGGDVCPLLVRFADIRDPGSVEEVNPRALPNAFGPGVSLHSIIVEITDEPFTAGVAENFPWWDDYYSGSLDGTKYGDTKKLSGLLTRTHFIRTG